MMNIYKISLKLYLQVILILSCLFAVSCTDDDGIVKIDKEEPTATVKLSIRTPKSSLPRSMRASSTENEENISRVKVLVFKLVNGAYEYQYRADGEEIVPASSSNPYTTFTAKIISSEDPLKLILVANYQDAFEHYSPQSGTSEVVIRQNLSDAFVGDLSEELPMYGEVEIATLDAEKSNSFSVTMLRSIARVDIMNEIDPLFSAPFVLQEVYLYRANDRILLIPDSEIISDITQPSVSAASIPGDAGRLESAYYPLGNDPLSITGIYIPESLPVTDESLQLTTPTCIVVGGLYDGDTDPTYYRIDFNSGLDGHPFGQVLRNIRYVFNIKQVNERGWVTPDGAANNIASSIVAEMQIWNEMTHEMYFSGNDNYLGISKRKVVLNYAAKSEEIVYLQATLPFKIRPTDQNGNPTGELISAVGESFENEFFKLTIKKQTSDGKDVYQLVVTSLQDNRTDNPFTGFFQVYTDFWTFDVEVEQETYLGIYSSKIVQVLTITSLPGDLGTDDGYLTPDVSGDAMRKVIENKANFSPSGTVPVGGILVHNLLNETISSSSAESMYILQKMLEVVDVVQLPYLSTPSVRASELIYNWVESRDDRVLILGIDDGMEGVTNANLIPYFTDDRYINDGKWYERSAAVFEIGTVYAEEGSEVFFDGPFGFVEMNQNMGRVEGTLAHNNGYNSETTIPILWVTESTDVETMMTHGINKEIGVFYCGESEITSSRGNGMSAQAAQTGTVTSQLDILMANIWNWIVERTVEGKK